MRFPQPLISGVLIKRYKRFLADIRLDDGTTLQAHCPNSGAMLGLTEPGNRVWVSKATNPLRKLKYTWELVEAEGTLIGVNTQLPNELVEEALLAKKIPELASYPQILREVRYGDKSRIDFLLGQAGEPPCYVEVKNVHLRRGNAAFFPDCVTARGAKHMRQLQEMVRQGARAAVLYVVQRADVTSVGVAADLDPVYAQAAEAAMKEGVEMLCFGCHVDIDEIYFEKALSYGV